MTVRLSRERKRKKSMARGQEHRPATAIGEALRMETRGEAEKNSAGGPWGGEKKIEESQVGRGGRERAVD